MSYSQWVTVDKKVHYLLFGGPRFFLEASAKDYLLKPLPDEKETSPDNYVIKSEDVNFGKV